MESARGGQNGAPERNAELLLLESGQSARHDA
jgi:hypothetical protein